MPFPLFCWCNDDDDDDDSAQQQQDGKRFALRFLPWTTGRRKDALAAWEGGSEDKKREQMWHQRSLTREEQIKWHSKSRSSQARRRRVDRGTVYARPIDLTEPYHKPPSSSSSLHPKKTQAEIKKIANALGDNFIFADLSEEQRVQLMDAMQKEFVRKGTEIIAQGEEHSDYFYIIDRGTVEFLADGARVGSASDGGSFGELALLYHAPRAATCLAATDCKLWKVDQHTFRYMMAKSANDQERERCDVLNRIDLFSSIPDSCKLKIAESLTRVRFSKGERIIHKGDRGDVFYIIHSGTVRVHDIGLGDSRAVDQLLTAGDWFGERALLTGEPRAAHVTAVSEDGVTCLALDRETFEETVGSLEVIIERGMKKRFLLGLPLFAANSSFHPHEMDSLVDCIHELCLRKGIKLAEIGKPYSGNLWIIRSGRVLVVTRKGEISRLKSGDYFGDKYIKEAGHVVSSRDVIVEEETTCWVLSREDVEGVIGDIHRLGDIIPFVPSKMNKSIQLNDIKKLRILGRGAFGKVWLVRHRENKTPYALKVIDKRKVLGAQQARAVLRERNIMGSP